MANPAADAHARVLAAHPEAVVVERGRYHIKHRLADGPDGRPRYVLDCWLPPIAGAAPDTISEQVGASADDGKTDGGGWESDGTSLQVGYHGLDGVADAYYRFTGISGLSGATIDVAYCELYSYEDSGTPLTKIFAEDAASPTQITSGADHAARVRTSAGVDYDGLETDGWHNTPSIVDVIQELADSYNPDAIQILHDDDGTSGGYNYQSVRSWDYNDNTYGPKLHIEYTAGGAGATISAVTATATADAPVPTITAVKNVVVSAIAGVAVAAALLASVAIGEVVAGEVATATAAALSPTVATVQNVTVAGEVATASASAPAPTIVTPDVTISAETATATAAAENPFVITVADGVGSCDIPIDVGADDGELWPDTPKWSNSTWFMELGSDIYGWWRWPSVPIPRGLTIQEAKIQFRAYSSDSDDCDLRIEGCDEDDSDALTSWADYAGRDKTSLVEWNGVEAWTINQWYWSGDFKAIVQAIVDREGWNSGQAIQVIVKGLVPVAEAERRPGAYDGGAAYSAELHLEWLLDVTISAVTATADATAPIPTIPDVIVSAEPATATATAPLPTVTAVKNVTVASEVAAADAAALLPTVRVSEAIAAEAATATADAPSPTVTAVKNVSISSEPATATAAALTPSVGISEIVVDGLATATAACPAPSISTGATISGETATATAAALAPSVGISEVIVDGLAAATAACPAPTITTDIVFAQFGKIIAAIDPDDYPSDTIFKLLLVLWTSNGAEPVYARLYNVTDGHAASGSGVSTASTSPIEVLSSALSLPSGDKTYRIEVGGVAGGTYYCAKAVVEGVV